MLWVICRNIVPKSVKVVVNFNDFLEVQFLEVDVHTSDEEVYQISLFQLVVP